MADVDQPNRWGTFREMLSLFGQFCHLMCPPIPELVTRKLAFHPPAKGTTYKILLQDGTEVTSAKELCEGQDFQIQLIGDLSPCKHAELMATIQPFTLTTKFRSQIVGVKVSPTQGALPHSRSHAEVVVLFSQPNSSDLGCLLFPSPEVLQRMANDLRVDVYTYDYSGYGYSTGTACEMGIYADIQAVYDHIRRTRPNAKILLVGFSLGTTASVHLAAQKPQKLAGVILLAAFCSGLSLFRSPKDPKEPNYWDRFRNIDRIHEIAVPVLLIHGSDDQIVPIGHSQEMYTMLKKPVAPLYVYGADHSTILSHPFTNLRMNRFLLQEADVFF